MSNAAECFAAQEGDAWAYDKGDAAAHVTVLNAGFNLPQRLQALADYNGARRFAAPRPGRCAGADARGADAVLRRRPPSAQTTTGGPRARGGTRRW